FTFLVILAQLSYAQNTKERIGVINVGTCHFSPTMDANSTEFDEHSDKNLKAAHEIAYSIAKAQPTILAVENVPERQDKLREAYQNYLNDPSAALEYYDEISMLVFEVGRLAGIPANKLFCIDHKLGYQYYFDELDLNIIDKATYNAYNSDLKSYYPDLPLEKGNLNLREMLCKMNKDEYLDFLIHINADLLVLYGTEEDKFKGADQAARYYQRNLRMFANFNAIPANQNDRIFALMGASHTAFFRDFISRSIKYKSVDVLPYLEEGSK
ncbi:MAG: DUF5694 domain-containing protein, partial [Bacteroidota bacterium]